MDGHGDSAARLRVTLLGAFQVCRGDTVLPVSGARVRGLLVRLALAGGRSVGPGVLVDALWPEDRPSDPANALQSLASRLRRALGSAGAVAQADGGYRLDVAAGDVDVLRFERLAVEGRERLRAGDHRSAAARLGEAAALWAGPPTEVEAVAPAVAIQLARASLEAVADLAESELALGRPDAAADRLTALLAEHPAQERVAALLMDALAAQGRQAEALELYERFREQLADRLGADPGAALRERHLRLLRAPDDSAHEYRAPTTDSVREYRAPTDHARNIHVSEIHADGGRAPDGPNASGRTATSRTGDGRIHEGRSADGRTLDDRTSDDRTSDGRALDDRVVDGHSPGGVRALGGRVGGDRNSSGRALGGTQVQPAAHPETPPGNLPASLTSFIGRDDDLARLDVLLGTGRLVTVAGPGGAGKTRLALEAARRHRHEFRDGAWMIDLASVTEPAKVAASVLAAIGLRSGTLFEGSGRKRIEGDEFEALIDQLNGRESLLVVDNCEHLIDAVAQLIASLLPLCAGLRVLATSREPLAVDGEALVPLGPLALPRAEATVDEARRAASVRLFTARAAAVRPGFDVDDTTLGDIVRVVRALDGMPLALELAAARLRTLSLGELAAGLSDRFRLLSTGSRTAIPRHRTLRAVIAWSWDLLGAHERTVAERVSVLAGGVTSASAVAVCAGTDVDPHDVPELLAALVDRSLLQLAPEAGRYRMLETLREYGTERLADQGELDATRGRAAHHLAALVARLDPLLRGPEQLDALRVMSDEYDNALAALRHLCDSGDADGAIALAMSLAWYWQMFGRYPEAGYWLGEALALPAGEHTLERDCAEAVRLLNRVSTRSVSDPADETVLRELTERLRTYPSLPGLGGALTAMALYFLQEFEASLAVLKELAEGPDVWLAGLACFFRAQFAENNGDLDQVRVDVDAALDRFGRTGDRWGRATVLPMRALLRQYDGDLDGAMADLRQARLLAREFGSLSISDEIFIDLRWIDLLMRRGDNEQAIAMIEGARQQAARSFSPELATLFDALEAGMWVRLGDLDRARELLDAADAGLSSDGVFDNHGRAIGGAVRASLCVELGDVEGAEKALVRAYAAALETRDRPILSLVAVAEAGLADLQGRHRDTALLLGAAARLRGAHDRTDVQIRELSNRGRAALGDEAFAEAYTLRWELDGKSAEAQIDPARLRLAAQPAGDSQARRA